ncbi:MAG: hypothetical protein K2Y18_08085 [Alphaproteobacteria bacterium]|nr:hypothetical protein [Alphaproteobacteria bacterium]
MTLKIETFDNHSGGNALYKALAHPITYQKMRDLLDNLRHQKVALYDPLGLLEAFQEFYASALSHLTISNIYAQDFGHIGKTYASLKGLTSEPLTALPKCAANALLILAFDADRLLPAIRQYIPEGVTINSLDDVRLESLGGTVIGPASGGSSGAYLTPLNFATNFAFFREQEGFHTRLTTANYWHRYGGKDLSLSCILFGEDGKILAQWVEPLKPSDHTIVFDSQTIKSRFKLAPFVGQLFFHVIGAKGHDVVKYALDTYNDDYSHISCTHDANSWPSDSFAGLPAPQENEVVYLWIQNSHPVPIPANTIGLNVMGTKEMRWLDKEIGPFASYKLNVADLLPNAKWPQQIEMQTGKYLVRPRYEVVCKTTKNQRIAHVNVQRNDLKQTISVASLKPLFGKNYILPAPILPQSTFQSMALPTPMGTTQTHLPVKMFVYDASGKAIAEQSLGVLPRDHATVVDCRQWTLPSGYGHMELAYDDAHDIPVDGWLHGLFRYERGDHKAETSFGAHMFNTALVYKNEPQSYAGPPPGLRTRLFLRVVDDFSDGSLDSMCFLIYPSSTTWHPYSETEFILHDHEGKEIAKHLVKIPCSGSYLFSYHETFPEATRAKAKGGYIIIRDTTCRLFGYHGTFGKEAFSFDHMFGF